MTDEQRASALWLGLVEYQDGRNDEQIIEWLRDHLAAVRADERRAIASLLRATSKDRIDGHVILRHLADRIEHGEHGGQP